MNSNLPERVQTSGHATAPGQLPWGDCGRTIVLDQDGKKYGMLGECVGGGEG